MEWRRPSVITAKVFLVPSCVRILLTLVLILTSLSRIYSCPVSCSCQTNSPATTPSTAVGYKTSSQGISIPKAVPTTKSKRGRRGRKVDCSNTHQVGPIESLEDIPLNSLPLDTVQLVLAGNKLSRLPKGAFSSLSMLRKLDLSSNQISLIESGAFQGLANLEKLDLSHNLIEHINISMFSGLTKLQRLSLSGNKLKTIPEGTFNNLPALKRISVQSDQLRCDCHLSWIVQWSQDKGVKISKSTTCSGPVDVANKPLKSLKKKDLHCQHPLELDIFEVLPHRSQVVFAGDKLPFQCRASVVTGVTTRIYWTRSSQEVTSNSTARVFIHTTYNPDKTIVTHDLVLEKLEVKHSGVWECHVATPLGNDTRRVNIVVISAGATNCDATTVHTNKGVYKWDKTVAGIRIEVPCKRSTNAQTASFTCNGLGEWESMNTDHCDYVAETTRRLAKFSKISVSEKNVQKTSKDLLSLIKRQKNGLTDAMDVVFLTRVIKDSFIPRISSKTPQAAQNVLDILSLVMTTSKAVLFKAQMLEQACSRLVQAVEQLSRNVIKTKVYTVNYSPNIMITSRSEPFKNFPGVACLTKSVTEGGVPKFVDGACYRGVNRSLFLQVASQPDVKAAILLPPTILKRVPVIQGIDTATVGVGIAVFNFSSLFPVTAIERTDALLNDRAWQPVSSVVSATIGQAVVNLSEPVIISLSVTNTSGQLIPVFWDFSANKGRGDWRSDGCEFMAQMSTSSHHRLIKCNHLTNFAILSSPLPPVVIGNFRILEPVVYAGSCLLLMLLMAVTVTYITCFRYIQMPKKSKHSIINISLSVFFMCISFTLGVNRVDHLRICQVVGVVIHYFSLCAMFWITITSSNMMKKLIKSERPSAPVAEPSMMPIPPKPIVRFYLLGWGVPVIICGITAAVDIRHYASRTYCFLAWEPSLGAFYGPVALLVIINFVFFLRISCVIRASTSEIHQPEETVELHTNEIELTNHDFTTDIASIAHSETSNTSSVLDSEHRPINQLRALVAVLFLYIVTWMCGAFAIAQPFSNIIPYQEMIFSYLYGVVCILYGMFMFCYYCVSRKDSRTGLKRIFTRSHRRTSRFNIDTTRVSNQISRLHRINQSGSSMNSSSSCNGKAVNLRSSRQLPLVTPTQSKQCNLNLVSSHNTSSRSITSGSGSGHNSALNFYNMRQNGVAKKYWEKRHYLSSISKGINNCSASCASNYGSNSMKHISGCTSSDTNTHFSIEIQIQASPGHHAPPNSSVSTPGVQKLYSRCDTTAYSPLNPEHDKGTARLAIAEGAPSTSQCSIHCPSDTTLVPPCSLAECTQPLVCTCGETTWDNAANNNADTTRELRPIDFDGQSQVSQDTPVRCRETQKNNHTINELSSNKLSRKCVKSFQSLSSSLNASPAHHVGSHWSSVSSQHRLPTDYSSDTNIQRARCKEAFLNELQQRIPPPSHRPLSPAKSDICHSTSSRLFLPNTRMSQHRVGIPPDSDHNSEPVQRHSHHHRHHHHHHRHHHHRNHNRHRPRSRHKPPYHPRDTNVTTTIPPSPPQPPPLQPRDVKSSWDSNISNSLKQTKPAYTFVDQEYIAKATRKVSVQSSEGGVSDTPSKSVHFSPTTADTQIQQGGMEAMAEDTSSSSEESGDDMWHTKKEKKSKKETSV